MATPLFGTSTVSLEAAQAWAKARGAHPRFVDFAVYLWRHAPAFGIPAEVPYGQSSWETDWGKFTGVLGPEKHNWGGIKTKTGWSDTDPDHHQTFTDDEQGAIALLEHLFGYGGKKKEDLPAGYALVDPRFSLITKYTDNVEGLGGAWAPSPTYGKNVAGRVADLRDFANNQTWEPPMAGDIPIIQMLLPDDASNTPQKNMAPIYITIHETANPKPGADAVMHGKWLLNLAAAGETEPSWHFTVDDHQIVQHLPINRAGYHAGDGADGTGNLQSIGIELCVNSDGDVQKTRDNAAWLVRKLRGETGIPVNRVVQHNHWSGKNCPTLLRKSGWAAFVEACKTTTAEGPVRPPDVGDPDAKYIPETGTWLQWGFKSFWFGMDAELRLKVLGYPISNEIGVNGRVSIQRFQRGVLIYDASQPDGWQITALPLDRYAEFGLREALSGRAA